MKKLLMLFVIGCSAIYLMANTATDVTEKVKETFNKTFPDAQNVSWYDNGTTFQVRFIRNGIDNRVEYSTDGTILQTTRYYEGKYLPAYLLSKLKKRFSDKKIHLVTELNNQDGLEFHISLQDDKRWYVVKAYANGSMEVYDRFNKQ